MENKRLRKIAILTALSASLLSGCGKKEDSTERMPIPATTTQVVETTEEVSDEVYNDTLNYVYNEYIEKSGEYVDIKSFKVAKYDGDISYVHKNMDGEYIYDKDIRADDPDYEWVDDKKLGTMYVVRINKGKNGENWYVPVCALAKIDGKTVNVRANLFDGTEMHYASDFYVEIEHPNKDNFTDLEKANDDIDSGKLVFISKEPNEYIMLNK